MPHLHSGLIDHHSIASHFSFREDPACAAEYGDRGTPSDGDFSADIHAACRVRR